ncbi:MAG TPA: DUF2203 domain-containing protein [Candidatus Dormibacteraeota bacterium]|nr:DUF2203 domain-containing protein [Candidatus Dormibacteraeota bacterium]
MTEDAPRTYTPAQANAALPEVEAIVRRVADVLPAIPEMQERVRTAAFKAARAVASEADRLELEAAEEQLAGAEMALTVALGSLERMAIQVKDPWTGLVDFLSDRDGELVELCWRLGEPSVAHWHRIGEGFRGRRPL